MLKRVLLAALLSWGFSITLGLLYAASLSGSFSFNTLRLPGMVPIALILSAEAAIAITPFAVWSLRTGTRNLYIYGPILCVALIAHDVAVTQRPGSYGPYELLAVSAVCLVILGLIPPK